MRNIWRFDLQHDRVTDLPRRRDRLIRARRQPLPRHRDAVEREHFLRGALNERLAVPGGDKRPRPLRHRACFPSGPRACLPHTLEFGVANERADGAEAVFGALQEGHAVPVHRRIDRVLVESAAILYPPSDERHDEEDLVREALGHRPQDLANRGREVDTARIRLPVDDGVDIRILGHRDERALDDLRLRRRLTGRVERVADRAVLRDDRLQFRHRLWSECGQRDAEVIAEVRDEAARAAGNEDRPDAGPLAAAASNGRQPASRSSHQGCRRARRRTAA